MNNELSTLADAYATQVMPLVGTAFAGIITYFVGRFFHGKLNQQQSDALQQLAADAAASIYASAKAGIATEAVSINDPRITAAAHKIGAVAPGVLKSLGITPASVETVVSGLVHSELGKLQAQSAVVVPDAVPVPAVVQAPPPSVASGPVTGIARSLVIVLLASAALGIFGREARAAESRDLQLLPGAAELDSVPLTNQPWTYGLPATPVGDLRVGTMVASDAPRCKIVIHATGGATLNNCTVDGVKGGVDVMTDELGRIDIDDSHKIAYLCPGGKIENVGSGAIQIGGSPPIDVPTNGQISVDGLVDSIEDCPSPKK